MSGPLDMKGWTDKDSKDPAYRELYERMDFVGAYARHTDMRAERGGVRGAIGRADEWESHGLEQLAFLKERGMAPGSVLLDIGCGPGRLARRAVPFLDPAHYFGMDIAPGILESARSLGVAEGWASRSPTFILGDGTLGPVRALGLEPDLVWAHSVVTHLPPELVHGLLTELAQMQFGEFLFTYKAAAKPQRSGLKQFQYPAEWFVDAARGLGLQAEKLPKVWPAHQLTMRVWR